MSYRLMLSPAETWYRVEIQGKDHFRGVSLLDEVLFYLSAIEFSPVMCQSYVLLQLLSKARGMAWTTSLANSVTSTVSAVYIYY